MALNRTRSCGAQRSCDVIVGLQGVSEHTDTFLSLPALVFITAQTLLGARINP